MYNTVIDSKGHRTHPYPCFVGCTTLHPASTLIDNKPFYVFGYCTLLSWYIMGCVKAIAIARLNNFFM